MTFPVTEQHFTTESQAYEEIAKMGWHASARDVVVSTDTDLHVHEFNTVAFIVSGSNRIGFADGSEQRCGAGCRVQAAAGTVHRELAGSNYRVIFGFDRDPTQFTQPINKPVA